MDARDAEFRKLQEEFRKQQEEFKKQQEELQNERGRRELAETRAEQAEEQTRRTTFTEMLEAGHKLSKSILVQEDKNKSTKGTTTRPNGKCCPTRLLPWKEFPNIQQSAFNELYEILHPTSGTALRIFSPKLYFEETGILTSGRIIGSEEDLKKFHEATVETHVARAITTLVAEQLHGKDWTFGQGLLFENHTNNLGEYADEVQEQLQRLQIAKPSSGPKRSVNPIHADQLCVFKNTNDDLELLFVVEYKAPHKISKEILRVGLREMDVRNEVIDLPSIPTTDPSKKFEYNADKLVAAVATQTYSYMLQSGCEYSCIITGEAIVFLWIKEDDSNTLYYHLAEPNEEVHAEDGSGFDPSLTAIGQLLSFCIMALTSSRRPQEWRDMAVEKAETWSVDWEEILRKIPQEQTKLEAPSSAYKPTRHKINVRSPYQLRMRQPKFSQPGCSPELGPTRDDNDDDPENPGDGSKTMVTPTKRGSGHRSQGKSQVHGAQVSSSDMNQRQYCTQACLLGLVRGTLLDENCPNTELHRQGKKGYTHLLNMEQFSEMVRVQLGTSLDRNCKELRLQGARGALFKVTLASHGYTFVGKATPDVFVPDLKHEGRMYGLLRSVQGKKIPVYLGNIDLIKPWRDLHVKLVHMLLMSWGGEMVHRVRPNGKFYKEIQQFESRIARLGVQHEDIRLPNMLWNQEIGGVMFIDFERSTEVQSSALQEISPNKKRKRSPAGVKTELGNQSQDFVIWSETSKRSPKHGNHCEELAEWSEKTPKASPGGVEADQENRCQELVLWSET